MDIRTSTFLVPLVITNAVYYFCIRHELTAVFFTPLLSYTRNFCTDLQFIELFTNICVPTSNNVACHYAWCG